MLRKALLRLLFHIGRKIEQRAVLIITVLAVMILGVRGFMGPSGIVLVCCTWLGALLGGWRWFKRPATRQGEILLSLEMSLSIMIGCFALVQLAGGPTSALQPLCYMATVYLLGFHERTVGLVVLFVALALELLSHGAEGWNAIDVNQLAMQCCYLVLFGVGALFLVQIDVHVERRKQRRMFDDERQALKRQAYEYRLVGAQVEQQQQPGRQHVRRDQELRLARTQVDAIHQNMLHVLDLLKRALDLQTCVLLWLDSRGSELRIKELVTDSSMVKETPISAHAGALGGIVKNRLVLNLKSIRGDNTVPYYAGPEQIGSFVGVPVLEEGHLRGVLCADRRNDQPFTVEDERLIVTSSEQIVRSIQTERVLGAVERSKYEHERFFQASARLNSALTLEQVYEQAFSAAAEIVPCDLAAITAFDEARSRHRICRVWGEGFAPLEGQSFAQNAGYVAMVVKNRHFLPAGRDTRDHDSAIFSPKIKVKGMRSVLVLPLIMQERAIGTFVLATRAPGIFTQEIREMLGVICNQIAISMRNGEIYKQMEEMATTDGLTGLPNHRTFQQRFDEMLARAERSRKPLSIVITDVDKFKSVNDTYGHPIGDMVLKRLAQVLAQEARKVDVVARYGGEEFALILEETDLAGAILFCERLRKQMAAQLMSSEKGSFRVTLSLGVSSYPQDGADKKLLIDRADEALYAAKRGGRNRVVAFRDVGAMKAASG